jgi:heterodisulfide reductase subunit A
MAAERQIGGGFMSKALPPEEKRGSVLVVGGGIAGMQAALDLADSGFYVYLAEKSAGIGGGMAQLDKTFPTNDCAM